MQSFGLKNVKLVNKGLWDGEQNLKFLKYGDDAGRISHAGETYNTTIQVTSLRPYLANKKIHFLKIDIEGAEYRVLKDIKDQLDHVERIFVEYHSFKGESQRIDEILFILKTAGFRLFINNPGLKSKNPFIAVNTYLNMNMQLNIYGTRL